MARSNPVTEQQVLDALKVIVDPDLGKDIVSLGFVKDLAIRGGKVAFTIELTTPACPVKERFKNQATAAVGALAGVEQVEVKMTANVRSARGPAAPQGDMIPGVRNTIAVTSGKGGVGKSTVACNLAVALRRTGATTGLLDADVYGPSIPTMFGVPVEERPMVNAREMIEPIDREHIALMSIGFLVEKDAAMIMRGPMLAKYVQEALGRCDWADLDYLIIDLPPGTGDVQLTLAQTIPLTGAIVVTTPQEVALADVRRAVTMCQKLNVPVLGIVENMSDPADQAMTIFGRGGGEKAAAEWGLGFLGRIELDGTIPPSSDAGQPIVSAAPDSRAAQSFRELAGAVAAEVSKLHLGVPQGGPTLRIVD